MRARPHINRWTVLAPTAVFVSALVLRVGVVVRSGGFRGNYGYDSGVYYAGAVALIHGRIPYRDFVFLHPPAVLLALSPSALLGRLTTDHIGFVSANLLFTLIGAANAVLVMLVARRFSLSRWSALIGGMFYAVWFGAVEAEYLSRLEPLGNFFLLLGLLALANASRPPTQLSSEQLSSEQRPARWLFAAGAAFGLAASVKIWFAAPLVVVALWLAAARLLRSEVVPQLPAARRVLLFVSGALLVGVVMDGPFLVLSRGVMWSRVVIDQLGRPRERVSNRNRLGQLTTLFNLHNRLDETMLRAGILASSILFAVVLVFAWRRRASRIVVLLAIVQLAIMLASPSWFSFYTDFAAVPLALMTAAAADTLPTRARLVGWVPTATAAAVSVAVVILGTFHASRSWHGADRLIAATSHQRCVLSDTPSGEIELNALDRGFSNGCINWVDVTGRTYFAPDKAPVTRPRNRNWQRDLRDYLLSGDAVFLVRTRGEGMTAATQRRVTRYGVLAGYGGQHVYRTAHTRASSGG